MICKKKFAVIGGDLRQLYLAKELESKGSKVNLYGFDKINDILESVSLESAIDGAEYIVLPLPVSRSGKSINAPFCSREINIDLQFAQLLCDKKVFVGQTSTIIHSIEKYVKTENFQVFDYYNEEFIIRNAYLTAEGALSIAISNLKKTLGKCKCLVVGYGRIGKILSQLLKNLGSVVTVSARKKSDRVLAETYGYNVTNISNENDKLEYDIIFNTVPAQIFDKSMLGCCVQDVIILDLASDPGGVDKKEASILGIKNIHALGIPGKFFPKESGEIVAKSIFQIIKEENL